jgi:O-antigen/teichoic acid export membrane protein
MNQPQLIFKNTVVLGISRLITKVGNALLAFLVARILYAAGLGVYSAALEYYSLIALAGGMGATDFLVREIAKDLSRTNSYVVHLSVMVSLASVVLAALFLIALPHLGYSAELATSMYVIILAIIPGTLGTIQGAVFVAHQRVEFVTYTTLVATIVNIAVSVYLLMIGHGAISLVIAFVVVQWVVMFCYFYFINRHIVVLHWEFDFSFALSLLREIKTFAVLSVLGGLFARPEVIILSIVQNETQIGFYSAALKAVDVWHIIPQIYMTNVFPVLSRSYHLADEKSQIILGKSVKYFLAMSLPLSVGMAVAAEPIVNLLYGSGFEPSIVALRLLAWNVPLFSLSSILWRALAARGQQSLVLRVRIITLLTRLGGGYLLISSLGSLGAAITAVTNLLLNTLLLLLYIKQDKTRLNLLHAGWRFALAALVMGLLTWALSPHLHLVFLVPMAGVVYGLLVFLLKAFSPDDFALFRQIWQPQIAREVRDARYPD